MSQPGPHDFIILNMHTYACEFVYLHMCLHIWMHLSAFIYMHIHSSICMRIWVFIDVLIIALHLYIVIIYFHPHNHHVSINSPRFMFLFADCATLNKVFLILPRLSKWLKDTVRAILKSFLWVHILADIFTFLSSPCFIKHRILLDRGILIFRSIHRYDRISWLHAYLAYYEN